MGLNARFTLHRLRPYTKNGFVRFVCQWLHANSSISPLKCGKSTFPPLSPATDRLFGIVRRTTSKFTSSCARQQYNTIPTTYPLFPWQCHPYHRASYPPPAPNPSHAPSCPHAAQSAPLPYPPATIPYPPLSGPQDPIPPLPLPQHIYSLYIRGFFTSEKKVKVLIFSLNIKSLNTHLSIL